MIHRKPIENAHSNDMDKTVDLDAKSTYTTEQDDDDDDESETISALTDPKFDIDDHHHHHRVHPRPDKEAPHASSSCSMAHNLQSATDIFQEALSDAADAFSLLMAQKIDSPLYSSMKHRLTHVADSVRTSASRVQSSVKSSVDCTLRHGREVRGERARRVREEERARLERGRAMYMAGVREECLGVANLWRDK